MGVEGLRWVKRALGRSGGPEMSVKSIRWLWRGLRWVKRALGGCGGPEMDRKGISWVWRT